MIILQIVWPLGTILGLLLAWRYHQRKIRAGLITPVDILNPSGIRWYLYAVPDDPEVCSSCREAHGTAFLASAVGRGGCMPPPAPCATPEKCSGMLLPFFSGWLEADDLLGRLRSSKNKSRRLSAEEVKQLVASEWEQKAGKFDRTMIHLLSAFLQERRAPMQAIRSYGAVLDLATLPRDQMPLISAYVRLAGLLAQRGNPRKAIQVIEHFEKRVSRADIGTFTPTGRQRRALSMMKPYLYALIDSDEGGSRKSLRSAHKGSNSGISLPGRLL